MTCAFACLLFELGKFYSLKLPFFSGAKKVGFDFVFEQTADCQPYICESRPKMVVGGRRKRDT